MSLYIDKNTNLIYEVKLFEEYALVRPLDPSQRRNIKKLTHTEFSGAFDEYHGNQDAVYDYLAGNDTDLILNEGTETMQ
jgi:hypothetical protein